MNLTSILQRSIALLCLIIAVYNFSSWTAIEIVQYSIKSINSHVVLSHVACLSAMRIQFRFDSREKKGIERFKGRNISWKLLKNWNLRANIKRLNCNCQLNVLMLDSFLQDNIKLRHLTKKYPYLKKIWF